MGVKVSPPQLDINPVLLGSGGVKGVPAMGRGGRGREERRREGEREGGRGEEKKWRQREGKYARRRAGGRRGRRGREEGERVQVIIVQQ